MTAELGGAGSDALVGAVSQQLERPIIATVTDAARRPVSGVKVTWAVTAGGGSVAPAVSTTDSTGRARTTWTLGPVAGINADTAVARVEDLPPVTFVATGAMPASGPWSSVVTGVGHICGLTVAGTLYCWGQNWFGQFGTGTPITSSTPIAGAVGLQLKAVGAGYDYTCGLTSAGAAYCWGSNQTGALGNGFFDPNEVIIISHPTPSPVTGNLVFAALSAGWYHVCGVTKSGAAYCWGDDSYGQVGDGITARVRVNPDSVRANLTFTTISAGLWHTCGVTLAEDAYCWGQATLLGDGTDLPSLTPVPVAGKLPLVSISAGVSSTCALAETGAAYCWGLNESGEVGDTTAQPRLAPVPVAGGLRFRSISVGVNHTCAVSKAGVAYCWGANEAGQLGVGDTLPRWAPTPVKSGVLFAGVAAGGGCTCGWSAAGGAFCWGHAKSSPSLVPVPVPNP